MRRRIELLCFVDLLQGFGEAAQLAKGIGIPEPGLGIVGIQRDCPLKLLIRIHKVPCTVHLGKGQRTMRLGQRIVERNSLARCGNRPRIRIVIPRRGIFAQQVVGIRQPRIGTRIAGVVHNGLREKVERPVQALGSPLVPLVPPAQIEVVGLAFFRVGDGPG